jgi:hypothetical protein
VFSRLYLPDSWTDPSASAASRRLTAGVVAMCLTSAGGAVVLSLPWLTGVFLVAMGVVLGCVMHLVTQVAIRRGRTERGGDTALLCLRVLDDSINPARPPSMIPPELLAAVVRVEMHLHLPLPCPPGVLAAVLEATAQQLRMKGPGKQDDQQDGGNDGDDGDDARYLTAEQN